MKKFTKLLISEPDSNISILQHFTKIFDFGIEIIKLPKLLSTGIYLWRNIFYFFQEYDLASFDDDDDDSKMILNLLFTFLNISSASLSSEIEEDRLQSLKFINILHDFLIDIEVLNEAQATIVVSLFQSLHQELSQSILTNNNELSKCCSAICSFMEEPPDFVDDQILSSFFDKSITFLSDRDLPIEKRYIIHTIFESSVNLIINNDCYRSKIIDLINISISLSVELCMQDRTDNDYELPYRFFYSLSDAFNDSESSGIFIFDLFMTIALNLTGNESINQNYVGIQVSLFVIKSIIESLQEIVSIRISNVVQFILQYGGVGDEYVLNSACQTIDELFEYVSSSASKYINEVTSFLTKYSTYPIAIHTLDSIFYRSDKPPSNIEFIFNGLTSMIDINSSNDQIEALLSCITSLFSRISNTEEHIMSSFLPFVNQIITSPLHFDLHSSIFEFFGRIVTVAPLTIKSELLNLINFAADSFSMTNFQLNISISFCLRSIAKVLPVSLSPFLPQVVPPLIGILQSDFCLDPDESETATKVSKLAFNDQNINDDFLSDLAKSQRESMLTLATLVGYLPREMSEYATSPILDFIVSDRGGLQRFLVHACEALAYGAEGYRALGVPLYEVVLKLVPLLHVDSLEKDFAFSIMMLCSEIVAVFGDVMTDDVIDLMVTSLMKILMSPPECFMLSSASSSSFDPQLQEAFFFLFAQSIDMFGEKLIARYNERFCQIMISCINSEGGSTMLRCNSILTAAHFCFKCQKCDMKNDTFCQIVQNAAVHAMMSAQSCEANVVVAKAIKFLILADKNIFQARLNMLIQFSDDVIEKSGYFGLLCSIVMVYSNVDVVGGCIEKVRLFIENLPPIPDSEDIVFFSEFVGFLLKSGIELENVNSKLPATASALFASSEKHFNSVSPEVRAAFASVIGNLPEEVLVSLNRADESKIMRINNHMKMIGNA